MIPNFSIEKFAPKGLCEQIRQGFARLYKVIPDFALHILVQEKFGMTPSPEIASRFRGLNPGHAKHGSGQSWPNSIEFGHAAPRYRFGADFALQNPG
jgi:hypothetical protein